MLWKLWSCRFQQYEKVRSQVITLQIWVSFQFCFWFSLARLPTETAREFFLYHYLEETALSFSNLHFEPVQCLGKTFFCPLSFAQLRKILSKFSKLSVILKHGGKNFVMMTSIARLSSNRSWARTNQNARITWAIIECNIASSNLFI